MLITENLTKKFDGNTAIDNLNIRVEPGELFALLGSNGAGKTSTINCFLGFLQPDAGRLLVDGLDVNQEPIETKNRLAYIPEQVNLYGYFTGLENLTYFCELAGKQYSKQALHEFLTDAGLQASAHDEKLSAYSKGMRQKVGIAIALAKQAKALLLDEPTSGLDPSASHEFSQKLHQLRERGVAILMATHDLFRAKEDATHVGIMRKGKLMHLLSGAELQTVNLEKLYLESMKG